MTVLLMLLALLSAAAFIAAEGEHDCRGEDCPVCALLDLCSGILHQPGDTSVMQESAVLIIVMTVLTYTAVSADAARLTPVSGKVRLNI